MRRAMAGFIWNAPCQAMRTVTAAEYLPPRWLRLQLGAHITLHSWTPRGLPCGLHSNEATNESLPSFPL